MKTENSIDELVELIEESNLSLEKKLHLVDILADSAKKQAKALFPIGTPVRVEGWGQGTIVKINRVRAIVEVEGWDKKWSVPFESLEPLGESVQV